MNRQIIIVGLILGAIVAYVFSVSGTKPVKEEVVAQESNANFSFQNSMEEETLTITNSGLQYEIIKLGIGEKPEALYIRKAVDWLKGRQRPDGGWGEDCGSYWQHSRDEVKSLSAWDLLTKLSKNKLPNAESIGRCRQKLQETDESLRGEKYKERHKLELEVKEEIKNWTGRLF